MKKIITLISIILPWQLRRMILNLIPYYNIHKSARIGFSWVFPSKLVMQANSKIGHLNIVKDIDKLEMGEYALINNLNWITGSKSGNKIHFTQQKHRNPQLIVKRHASITNRHLIDCSDEVIIGEFSTIGGYHTLILTHKADIETNMQVASPIHIGKYSLISTNCILLGGSNMPDYSVLAAKALLNKQLSETYCLYGGIPVRKLKKYSYHFAYFNKKTGFIY